jgi:hypothetical protein
MERTWSKCRMAYFDSANRVTSGRAPTLDEAKVRFLASWQKVGQDSDSEPG